MAPRKPTSSKTNSKRAAAPNTRNKKQTLIRSVKRNAKAKDANAGGSQRKVRGCRKCPTCNGKGVVPSRRRLPKNSVFCYFFQHVALRAPIEKKNDMRAVMKEASRCWRALTAEQKEDFKTRVMPTLPKKTDKKPPPPPPPSCPPPPPPSAPPQDPPSSSSSYSSTSGEKRDGGTGNSHQSRSRSRPVYSTGYGFMVYPGTNQLY